jgi:signal transduction histidine kinase
MLQHIESEKEARATNSELITSISHDIRTPLTVLMGYIEMMREHQPDEVMQGYIDATESTAMRLRQLSDDMFKYLLAFGDTESAVRLEDYDARVLFDQILSEHILLLRETGYDIIVNNSSETLPDGSLVHTDAQNLMRIVDNIFSNIRKYADMESPIYINLTVLGNRLTVEVKNRVREDTQGAESNKIGLKTCSRLGSLVAESFEYERQGEDFICRINMRIITPRD